MGSVSATNANTTASVVAIGVGIISEMGRFSKAEIERLRIAAEIMPAFSRCSRTRQSLVSPVQSDQSLATSATMNAVSISEPILSRLTSTCCMEILGHANRNRISKKGQANDQEAPKTATQCQDGTWPSSALVNTAGDCFLRRARDSHPERIQNHLHDDGGSDGCDYRDSVLVRVQPRAEGCSNPFIAQPIAADWLLKDRIVSSTAEHECRTSR